MKTMTDELKPCPFCGGDAKIKCGEIVNRYNTAVYRHYHVECMSCGVDTRYFDTEADAIEAWNLRAERTAKIRQTVEELKAAEPERKKGKWSNYKDEHCCSVCKCVVISDCWDDEIRYDYCPYCGAEME